MFEMPTIKDTIQLTEEEQALFKELLDATKQVGGVFVCVVGGGAVMCEVDGCCTAPRAWAACIGGCRGSVLASGQAAVHVVGPALPCNLLSHTGP